MKPGKPLTFATIEAGAFGENMPPKRKLVMGLPGNPVSSFVCFNLSVLPSTRVMRGVPREKARGLVIQARTTVALRLDPERPEFHRATLSVGFNFDFSFF